MRTASDRLYPPRQRSVVQARRTDDRNHHEAVQQIVVELIHVPAVRACFSGSCSSLQTVSAWPASDRPRLPSGAAAFHVSRREIARAPRRLPVAELPPEIGCWRHRSTAQEIFALDADISAQPVASKISCQKTSLRRIRSNRLASCSGDAADAASWCPVSEASGSS